MKLLPSYDQERIKADRPKSTQKRASNRKTTHPKIHGSTRSYTTSPRAVFGARSPALKAIYKALNVGVSSKSLVAAVKSLQNEHAAVRSLAKRRGRAKGGGQSSKAKGRSAVALVRQFILDAYPTLSEDDVFVKATSQGGCDIHLSPQAQVLFSFDPEVKCVEKLNVWDALAQATVNAKKHPPILFFKRAHSPLYVALRANDFLFALGK